MPLFACNRHHRASGLLVLAVSLLFTLGSRTLQAQHHGYRSSPATAPAPAPPVQPAASPAPPVAVSSGLGAIQFVQVSYSVPAPQVLARQLRFDDDHVRGAALSALGVPTQYLQRGRIPYPHSVSLSFSELGTTEDQDALLTVELDEHIVTAVLVPMDNSWKRMATLTFATEYVDPGTTPDSWLRLSRSLVQRDRYRAIFHASTGNARTGDFTENEAHLRVLNGHAVITLSFVSTLRECGEAPAVAASTTDPAAHHRPAGCSLTERWFQSEPLDPWKRFDLVTATGHISATDATSPLMEDSAFRQAHLRSYTCQPFEFQDAAERFEPTGEVAPCPTR